MTADLPSPYRHVHLLASSQSCTFHVSLGCIILFSVVMSSFSRYICPQKFPQCVIFFSPDHVPIPVHTIFYNSKETRSQWHLKSPIMQLRGERDEDTTVDVQSDTQRQDQERTHPRNNERTLWLPKISRRDD